jgi:hypothetical protein
VGRCRCNFELVFTVSQIGYPVNEKGKRGLTWQTLTIQAHGNGSVRTWYAIR